MTMTNYDFECMNCQRYLGYRGFCTNKCFDEYYEKTYGIKENKDEKKEENISTSTTH